MIEGKLGKKCGQVRAFYELHDGVLMYEGQKSQPAGLKFFKVDEWDEETAEVHEWYSIGGGDEEEMPECYKSGCAIAEIPQSGNRFVIATKGRDAGKIYYFDHDDYSEDPIAKTFDEFLGLILKDPVSFLDRFGYCTRYSDGKSGKQLIPKSYSSDGAL